MGDDGLFRLVAEGFALLPQDNDLHLIPGMLESSNFSPFNSMIDMIAAAHLFDMHMKVISIVDDNEKSANQLLTLV